MRPTAQQLAEAVAELGICKFFPAGPGERKAIMRLLANIVSTKQQLDWLVATMINRVGEWKGPMELRGVFCWKFKPADGIEANCIESAGFTPSDGEAQHHEIQSAERARLGPSPKRLMIEGHISPEDVTASERARLEAFTALSRVKDVPDAKPIRLVTRETPSPLRPITEADFAALGRKA